MKAVPQDINTLVMTLIANTSPLKRVLMLPPLLMSLANEDLETLEADLLSHVSDNDDARRTASDTLRALFACINHLQDILDAKAL